MTFMDRKNDRNEDIYIKFEDRFTAANVQY